MNLNAQIIEENGKPKFAMLPIQEYETLLRELSGFESLEDLADYMSAVRITAEIKNWHSLEEVKKQLGIE